MLNEKIKELRIARGLTQVELASDLGVTKQCISNWENNNIQPSIDMLIKIATYFSVTTDFLLGLDSKKQIDVSSLTEKQISNIRQLINDISANNQKSNKV